MTNTMPVLTDEQREKIHRYLSKVLGRHEAFTPIGEYSECHRLVHEIAKAALTAEPKVIHPPLRWHEDGKQKLMVQVDREWEGRAIRAGFTIGERQ